MTQVSTPIVATAEPDEVAAACYVFGVVPAGTSLPAELDDGDPVGLRVFEAGAVAAIVQDVDPDRAFGSRADLFAHHRVLDAVAATGPVVPMTFGSVLPGDTAVAAELLEPQHDQLVDTLGRLDGTAQFSIQARYVEEVVLAEVVMENKGVAELWQRTRELPVDVSQPEQVRLGELVARAMQDKRATDGQHVVESIAPYCVEHQARYGGGLDDLVDVAVLVEHKGREAFEQAAERLAESMSRRARLRMLGPSAPYDFVPGA